MVEDMLCEDADWGYCLNEDLSPATSTANCDDITGWHDSDGDICSTYATNQWCSTTGQQGPGWHEEWGSMPTFAANGHTAMEACCACGGGQQAGGGGSYFNQGTLLAPSSDRNTFSGCKCKQAWDEVEGMSCNSGCCNPDNDPAGDWCIVEDAACEDGDWGYCRPSGSPTSTIETGDQHGHCTDSAGWTDMDGEGCAIYTMNAYCTDVGGYGLGWNLEWGTFISFAQDGWTGANVACCACGGGTRDDSYPENWAPGSGTEVWVDPNAEKVRETYSGCECKKRWSDGGEHCNDYCCNVDNDPIGAWCKVKDENCEDADWGYCQTSGLGTVVRPMQEAHLCQDSPQDWTDADGDGCSMYQQSVWCNATGGVGSGWHEEWGTLQSFAKQGAVAAPTACCACGGGQRIDELEQSTMDMLAGFLGEEVKHMWRVTHGPCKMDEQGCVMSGNYPEKYGAKEECQIAVNPSIAVPIELKDFHTEFDYDTLKVNGKQFSGDRGPAGVIPTATIHWGTDSRDQRTGWKLCPRGEVATRNPAIVALKIVGVTVLVIMSLCCCCIIGLMVASKRKQPHGDGLGAGPKKIGKKYASEVDGDDNA